MAQACPTKEVMESPEWKALVNEYGEPRAIQEWNDNGQEIPDFNLDPKKWFVESKGVTQEVALNKLEKTRQEISDTKAKFLIPEKGHMLSKLYEGVTDPKERTIEVYQTELGVPISTRVTMMQDVLFRRYKTKEEADEINNRPENKIKARRGTDLHAVVEEIIKAAMEGRNPLRPDFLTKDQFTKLVSGVQTLINELKDVQSTIDPNGKVQYVLENVVWDKDKDVAGTIDLLGVFSDGSAAIYDYKFVNFKTDKSGKVIDAERTLDMKEESWDMQIGEYKRILMEKYGIKTIRQSRIIPVNVQYKYAKDASGKSVMTDKVKLLEMGTKEYTAPIPVANELTEDRDLNRLLSDLFSTKQSLKVAKKGAKNIDAIRAKITRLNTAIRAIQRKKDLNYIIKELQAIGEEVNKHVGINNPDHYNYLNDNDLIEYRNHIKAYQGLLTRPGVINRAKEKNPELYNEEFVTAIKSAMTVSQFADAQITAKITERASDNAMSRGIYNLEDAQRETLGIQNQLKYLSDWTHPVFRTFKSHVDEVIDNTRRDVNKVEEDLKVLTNNLIEWGKANGKTGVSVFDPLLNSNGDLVPEFSLDYWELSKKARKQGDVKWFKENFKVTEEDKKRYKEKLEEQKQFVERFYNYQTPEFRKYRLERWIAENDLVNSDEAWLNKFAVYTPKDRKKWQSEDYKYIQNNKALKEYYDFYVKMNEEFKNIVPPGLNIKKNFVANISKDMVDLIADSGIGSIKGMGSSMLQALQVREDDATFGMTNTVTGEIEKRIPILYTKPLTDHKGKVDTNLKSRDLSRSLLLFAKTIYNYKHVEKIESATNSLREVLATNDQIMTDNLGKPLIDFNTKEPITKEGSAKTLEAFDAYVDFYIYGRTTQSKDIAVKIGGKSYSGTKLLKMAMQGFSLKTLAGNPISAGANYVGATANLWMQAHKKMFFDKKQLRSAHKLNVTGDKKAAALFMYLETEQEDLTYRKANELSASKIATTFTMDKAYALQQKGDAAVDMNTTIAMAHNYGIEEGTGRVRKLSKLPKGSKSIIELTELKNDKVVVEGLTEQGYNQFRRLVRKVTADIKGQYSNEDIFMANTHIVGQSFMMFRRWMPKMVSERFRKAKYTAEIDEVELGRFRVFTGEIIHKGILPGIGNLLSVLGEVALLGAYKHKLREGATRRYFDQFIAENPELKKRLDDGELSEEDLLEMYTESRLGQIRAFAAELRMYLIVVGAIAAAGVDWDDDGEKLSEELPAIKYALKITERAALELGFWFSPSEARNLLRSPLPIMGLLLDLESLLYNTIDETRDVIVMEDYKGVIDWELDPKDKKPKLKYTAKFIPFINPMTKFFDYFDMVADDEGWEW